MLDRLLHIIEDGNYFDISNGYTSMDEASIKTNVAYVHARDVFDNSHCEQELNTALHELISVIRGGDYRSDNDTELVSKI